MEFVLNWMMIETGRMFHHMSKQKSDRFCQWFVTHKKQRTLWAMSSNSDSSRSSPMIRTHGKKRWFCWSLSVRWSLTLFCESPKGFLLLTLKKLFFYITGPRVLIPPFYYPFRQYEVKNSGWTWPFGHERNSFGNRQHRLWFWCADIMLDSSKEIFHG